MLVFLLVRRRGVRGQVLPLIALCLLIIMGFSGLAVDVGSWEYEQRQQQNATDAAALGGAQQLGYGSCPNLATATAGAQTDATANGFTPNGNVSVTVQNPPNIGPFTGDACAVYVKITTKGLPAHFSRFFGFAQGATESTEA